MARHRKRSAMRAFAWVVLLASIAGLLGVAYAGQAKAIDLPGVEVCPKSAPFAVTPESGLAGLLGERPLRITTDNTPQHVWTTGGFAGLKVHTYDLGCAIDPTSYLAQANANAGAGASNAFLSVGDTIVSLTDSLDRRAWSPGWMLAFLEQFADRAVGTANTALIIPFLGVMLAAVTILMLWKAHEGNMSGTANGIGWIMIVFTISALLIASPLAASRLGSTAGGGFAAQLNGGEEASDAITNQVVYNVQYQGWLRRTFGTAGPTAQKYGPELLASTRVSWAEMDTINALPADRQAKARDELTEKKAKAFESIAAKVESEDKTAYRHLTGRQIGTGESIVEMLFLLSASLFRMAVSILMIACVISLAILACLWVILTPLLIMPPVKRWSGQQTGIGLLNNGVRALLYVAEAAVAAWLFGIYLQACMAPGIGLGWSLLLLILGTVIAWAALGPFGKLRSILTLGRADGASFMARAIKGALMTYATGMVGGLAAAWKVNKHTDEKAEEQEEEKLSENRPQPQVVQATIFSPGQAPDMWSNSTFRPNPGAGLPGGGPASLPTGPVYTRPADQPEPLILPDPPDYTPYERTDNDDNEGARS